MFGVTVMQLMQQICGISFDWFEKMECYLCCRVFNSDTFLQSGAHVDRAQAVYKIQIFWFQSISQTGPVKQWHDPAVGKLT